MIKIEKERKYLYFGYALLFILLAYPFFGKLEAPPIRVWDEARQANNAYEMYRSGNVLVTYFEDAPDMWNTKPPFLIWCQALGMKIFGPGELAVRLPSAIAGVLTCFFLLLFSVKYLKNFWFGFIAALILVTSNGYVDFHGARTGDYDAMLIMFSTFSYLSFFLFLEKNEKKYLYFFFFGLALSVLTKSITALIFLPGLLIYTLWQRKFLLLLKNRDLYIGFAIFLFLVGAYYLAREQLNPGYLAAVIENEWSGRYFHVIDGHQHKFRFFYDGFIKNDRFSYLYILPFGIISGFFIRDKRIKNLTLFSVLLSLTYFLFISFSKTKLIWYDLPLYPFMALLVAAFCYYIFDLIKRLPLFKPRILITALPYLCLLLFFIKPYHDICLKVSRLGDKAALENEYFRVGYFLRNGIRGNIDLNGYCYVHDRYDAQNLFYLNILKSQGVQIERIRVEKLSPRENVIVYFQEQIAYVEQHYEYEVLFQEFDLMVCNILSVKEDTAILQTLE